MNESQSEILIPREFARLLDSDWREAAVWGGRYSLKSMTVANILLTRAINKKLRIGCFREYQNSIADSSHQLLKDIVDKKNLNMFKVTDNSIVNTINGSEFLFKGLHHNIQSVKSIEGIDIAWVEEAQTVSEESIEVLTPTIRKPGSQIIYTYNRLRPKDPVYKRLVIEGRPNTILINVNYDIAIKYGMMPDEILNEINDDKANRPGLYKYKWMGEPDSIEGRIYNDWAEIDTVPHEASLVRYGLDFGYSCLKGDTLIKTNMGDKYIKDVMAGDMVLTRNGYNKVTWAGSKGVKPVYDVDFGYGKRIIVTGEHRIFTTSGWKRVDELSNKEIICVTKSSSMEKSIRDILMGSTLIISIVKSVVEKPYKRLFYIVTYGKRTLERYLRGVSSTTKTVTHLIMKLTTLSPSLQVDTPQYTTKIISGLYQRKICGEYTQNMVSQMITGQTDETNHSKLPKNGLRIVPNAVRQLYRQMFIKSSVAHNAERKQTLEKIKKNIPAKTVTKSLWHHLTSSGQPVLKNVRIHSRLLKEKCEVFDLTVNQEREFFANGVLVHNCDPTAIIAIYYYNGGYILDEVTYLKGLSNKSIADILNNQPRALVIADSAEPKSIDEIMSYGINILGVTKGKDSVSQGIQYVQQQRISVTKRSTHIIESSENYTWFKNKDGVVLNEPDDTVHEWSNSMDAIRYGFDSLKPKKEHKEHKKPEKLRFHV